MSIKTILESLFRLAVIACLSLTAPSALSKEMQSTVIQLEAIPQISKAALSKKGITYQINEPIAYIASENIAIYDQS
jgi:NACalpha-BTF3-like transcription factor